MTLCHFLSVTLTKNASPRGTQLQKSGLQVEAKSGVAMEGIWLDRAVWFYKHQKKVVFSPIPTLQAQ